MSLRNKFIILAFFFPVFIIAQDFEGGLSFGLITYQGDLVDGLVEVKETNLSYGVTFRAVITDKITLRGNYFRGLLTGTDANSSKPGRRSRMFRFKTPINEFSIMGEWNFLGQDRSDNRGLLLRQKFTPYVFGGVGFILFEPETFQDTLADPEGTDYSTSNISVPIGFGVKIGLNERFIISAEAGGRTAFTDYLDGISKLANSSNNDWYWMGSIIFTYTFGSPSYF